MVESEYDETSDHENDMEDIKSNRECYMNTNGIKNYKDKIKKTKKYENTCHMC